MENSQLSKNATSFGLAVALASAVNAVLVVIKEKSPAVESAMKNLTGHHWITHSVIVLGVFVLAGLIFSRANAGQGVKLTANSLLRTLVAGVATGAVIIFGFYLFAD
jgi:hypothetical protein